MEVLTEDTFDRTALGSHWSSHTGAWATSSGRARTTAVASPGLMSRATQFSDGLVTVRIPDAISSFTTGQGIGFRVQDASNFWMALLYRSNDSGNPYYLYLRKYVGGTPTDLISALDVTSLVSLPITFTAEFIGPRLRVFLNGRQGGTTQTDSQFATNRQHGLVSWNTTTANLDEFRFLSHDDRAASHRLYFLPSLALQTIRPDGDVTVGSWQNELGGTTNLWQSIDETSTDDADYVTRTL